MADNIEIEIDGKKLTAQPNAMVIQVADEAGIYIPRFCYHKNLTIAANCRMCLVEVEKVPKPLPACATPVTPGMKVFTRSAKALAAQKSVMEFLLINHPLDCPICDQGGECELQDLSLGFGAAESFYSEGKRAVKDKDIGPLIETEMTRCIHCTRCVRFGAEIAGMRELGGTGRGEHLEIGTYIEHAMRSEISGNVIDLCPVGALTSKPFRFTARAWELEQRETISPHDCIGSNLNAHSRTGTVMRMVPRENPAINEMWISDRDRFSYQGLYHEDRVQKPLIKKNDIWEETTWLTALEVAASGIQKISSEKLGALASPNSTNEEFYLLQKLLRTLGSDNIDYRLRQSDFSDQKDILHFSQFGASFAELETCDVILLIGSNLQKDQPVLFTRLRKAYLKGAKILAVDVMDYQFNVDLAVKHIVAPDELVPALGAIAGSSEPNKYADAIREVLKAGKTISVLVGNVALNHPQACLIRKTARNIAKTHNAHLGFLTEGANAAGANLVGAIPHYEGRNGLHVADMLEQCKGFLLLNVEPDFDFYNCAAAISHLRKAEFVVAFSQYSNHVVNEIADVILPIGPFTETAGSFVNACGDLQKFKGVATPFADAKPAWKVLRVLANLMGLEGFDFKDWNEAHDEVKARIGSNKKEVSEISDTVCTSDFKMPDLNTFSRIGCVPIYASDGIVRRAKALQAAQPIVEPGFANVRVHPAAGAKLRLTEGELVTVSQEGGEVRLPVLFDKRLPLRGVYVAAGLKETAGLGDLFGEVKIK